MAARSPEQRAALKFIEALSHIDFDFGIFGVVLAQSKPIIQRRVLEVFVNYMDALAYRHTASAKFMDEDEIALCKMAIEFRKAIKPPR